MISLFLALVSCGKNETDELIGGLIDRERQNQTIVEIEESPFPFKTDYAFEKLVGSFKLVKIDSLKGKEKVDISHKGESYYHTNDSVYVMYKHFVKAYKKKYGRNDHEGHLVIQEECYYHDDTLIIHVEYASGPVLWKYFLPINDSPEAKHLRQEEFDWSGLEKMWALNKELSDPITTIADDDLFPSESLEILDLSIENERDYYTHMDFLHFEENGEHYTLRADELYDDKLILIPISQCNCEDLRLVYELYRE